MTHLNFSTIPTQLDLGEGVLWHPTEQRLYWVDIYAGALYRQDAAGNPEHLLQLETTIGAFGFRRGGGVVMATGRGFARCDATFDRYEYIVDPESDRSNCRFNDGAVDRRGCFWAGTMEDGGSSDRESALYRLDTDGHLHIMLTGLGLVNGMGWSPDDRLFYLTDSAAGVIWQFDYNADTGRLHNQREFITVTEGTPDGLTVDVEGYVWSAHWGGGRVVRYAPDGSVDQTIPLPTSHPTSPTFGGPSLHTLYISSARRPLDAQALKDQPHAGDIFITETEFHGQTTPFFEG